MGSMATWTVSLGMRMLPRSGSRPLSPLPLSNRTSSRAGLSLRLRLPIARTPFTPSHLPPSSRPTVYPNGLEAASRPHEIPRPSHRGCMQAGEWGSWAPRKKQGDRGVASTTSNWSGSPYASPSRGAAAVTNHTRRTHHGRCPPGMVYLGVMACLGRAGPQGFCDHLVAIPRSSNG